MERPPNGLLDTTQDVGGTVPKGPPPIERGTAIGRYVVLSRLGAGAMGVVYDAYDPELARKVAIKVLHHDLQGDSSGARRRLLREAQALARLSHPNVVAIYDVGVFEAEVWLAMEFVAGITLRQWSRQSPRGWREVVEVFFAAGRGLASAHAAGLVHRDFKSDNVMIDDGGRVRVMDFGLARYGSAVASVDDVSSELPAIESTRTASPPERSVAGRIVGTPAYMAPEQHAGAVADPRSDQFSFCVALWECLWGVRPYSGETLAELATAIVEGRRHPVPDRVRVPTWLRRVCERGLSPAPDRRFTDMEALLAAIEAGSRRAHTRRVLLALAAFATVPGAAIGWAHIAEQRRLRACEQTGAAIDAVWPGEHAVVRERSRAALIDAGGQFGETTAMRVTDGLDDYVARWSAVSTSTCLAAGDAAADPRILDCLDERRVMVASLGESFEHADAITAAGAAESVARLADPDICAAPYSASLRPLLPTGAELQIGEIRRSVASAHVLVSAGKFDEALVQAGDAAERARTLAWPPLIADAELAVARAARSLSDFARERDALASAYREAGSNGAVEAAATAAIEMIDNASNRDQLDEAGVWSIVAEVALNALSEDDVVHRSAYALALGEFALDRGDVHEAEEQFGQALAQRELAFGRGDWASIAARSRLAYAQLLAGDAAAAAAGFEEVRALTEGLVGPEHPKIAVALNDLSSVSLDARDLDRAVELQRRALAIAEAALDPESLLVSRIVGNLGVTLSRLDEELEALAMHERSLAIAEKWFGTEHREYAAALVNLGNHERVLGHLEHAESLLVQARGIMTRSAGSNSALLPSVLVSLGTVLTERGRAAEAIELYREAARIVSAELSPEHPMLGVIEYDLGWAEGEMGRVDVAREHYQRAIRLWEANGDPNLVHAYSGLAEVEERGGDLPAAAAACERGIAVAERSHPGHSDLPKLRLQLATVLVAAGGARERARGLAELARAGFESKGDRGKVAKAEALLARLARRR